MALIGKDYIYNHLKINIEAVYYLSFMLQFSAL